MSTYYYLVCDECKASLFAASSSILGIGRPMGDGGVSAAKFIGEHARHKVDDNPACHAVTEHDWRSESYRDDDDD